MKYVNQSMWDKIANKSALIFFAESINEMLFDHTFDSYKWKYHNINTLIKEALYICALVKDGKIYESSLKPTLKEIILSFPQDLIIQKCITKDGMYIFNKIEAYSNQKNLNINDLFSALNTLEFLLINYKKELVEELENAIQNSSNLNHIYTLTKSFLTEVLYIGYSKKFIYHTLHFFFYSTTKRVKANSFRNFINKFDGTDKKFTTVSIIPKIFIKFDISDTELIISEKLPTEYSDFRDYLKSFNPETDAFLIHHSESLDHFSAAELTEEMISKYTKIAQFYLHDNSLNISNNFLVYEHSNKKIWEIDNTSNVMLIRNRPDEEIAVGRIKEISTKILFHNIDSLSKIVRAFELHSISLTSTNKAIQLTSLWSALEALFSRKSIKRSNEQPDDSSSNIFQHVISRLIPLLMINYIQEHINHFRKDFRSLNSQLYYRTLKDINQTDIELEKIYALISKPELSVQRDELIRKFNNKSPLLSERLLNLHKNLNSFENLKCFLSAHENRLKIHLNRIYIARNLIVHRGYTETRHLEMFVENIHSYFDQAINSLFYLSMQKYNNHCSIDDIIYDIYNKYENFKSNKKNDGFCLISILSNW